MNSYHFFVILILTLIAYCISVFLVKLNKIQLIKHRRIWNILLLITFFISGIMGLILAFCVDNNISFSWYREFLWFHVEFGISMAIISIFHFAYHLRYYINIFKKKDNTRL